MYATLIQNSAFLIALSTLYNIIARIRGIGKFWIRAINGLLFGTIAIACMNIPFHYDTGIIYDARSIILSMAGLFGGGVCALISTLVAGLYRAYLGGAGVWAGLATIVSSSAIGLAYRRIYKNHPERLSTAMLYGFGIVVHLIMLICQLLILPSPRGLTVIRDIWLPVLLIFPVASVLVGVLLGTEERRNRIENELRESEEKLRLIFENIADGISIYIENDDPQKRKLVDCNEQYARMAGRSKEELLKLGYSHNLQISIECPSNKDRKEALEKGEVFGGMFSWIRPDGKENIIEYVGVPVVWRKKQYSIGIDRDVTRQKKIEYALRESELRYRVLFESASEGILVADVETKKINYANPAICRMLGYTENEITQLTVRDIHPKENLDLVLKEFEALAKGEKEFSSNIPCLRKDGSVFYADVSAKAVTISGRLMNVGMFLDVTERKLAEEKLKESEERYRAVVEHSHEGILIVGSDYNFEYVNDTMCQMLGYERDEIIGKDFRNFLDEESKILVTDRYIRRQRGEDVPPRYEFNIVRKDGTKRRVEISSTVVRDSHGRVKTIAQILDITERKQAEEALRQAEENFRHSLDESPLGVRIATPEGETIYANKALLDIYGYKTLEEFNSMPVWQRYTPESYEEFKKRRELRDRGQFGPTEYEISIYDRRGNVHNLQVFRKEILWNKQRRFQVIYRDITENKKAEEALRRSREQYERFFNEDLTGAFIADGDGTIATCNPAFIRIFGFDSIEEALHTNLAKLFLTIEQYYELISRLQAERKLEYIELEMRKLDGTKLNIVANIIGRFTKHDELREIQGYIFDDTKRRQLEDQLREAQKFESLGTLASGIAHDFNNILSIVLAHASILEENHISNGKYSKSIEAIINAANRGASLVKQMLTFARKAETVFVQVNVNDIVKEVAQMIQETFPKTIEVKITLAEDLPLINGDPTQIHQVMLNLCVNARDAMPNGGTLMLKTEKISASTLNTKYQNVIAEEYVSIVISDTGVGMDENTRSRIFEPFFTTKAPGQGTGLGLAVVHGIVNSHNGFIDVETELGSGTSFYIYFPSLQKTMLGYETLKITIPEIKGGSETILVVEDEEYLRTLLQTILESKGYNVLTARDGKEAIQMYEKNWQEIDIVLSDLGLPKTNGEVVLREIRKVNPRVKVVLASGFIEPRVRTSLMKIGVDGFISKPYTPKEVLLKVREILDAD